MRDIQNDLFEVKETYCESCKYNILGKTWCSKYEKRKPVDIMTGSKKEEREDTELSIMHRAQSIAYYQVLIFILFYTLRSGEMYKFIVSDR